MKNLIPVTVYCDSTDLYTEEEIMQENLCELYFPEEIVRAWYDEHENDFVDETRCELGENVECNFETWLHLVYTADDTDGLYDFAISQYEFQPYRYGVIEQVEVCPHCDSENVYYGWDPDLSGFVANCEHCGEEIFLCDACLHHDDNPERKCDWCELSDGGKCFRGRTKLRN